MSNEDRMIVWFFGALFSLAALGIVRCTVYQIVKLFARGTP